MKLFSNSPSWTNYRAILAEEFGIVLTTEPEEYYRVIRGHNVRIDHWAPSGMAKGTLILVHGAGGNGRILAPLAEPMAQRGWKVLAPDLPGFGLTRPEPGYTGEYAEWPAVISAIADGEPGPTVLMGLSMGGLTASWRRREFAMSVVLLRRHSSTFLIAPFLSVLLVGTGSVA